MWSWKHSLLDEDTGPFDFDSQDSNSFGATGFFSDPSAYVPPAILGDGAAHAPPANPAGTVIAVLSGDGAGSTGTITQTMNLPGTVVSGAGSAFTINVTWDTSVANAPAAFKTDVMAVVQFLETEFTDPVTININVGYGEVAGQALDPGALGESSAFLSSFSYSQLRNALVADAKTATDAAAIASLPATDPASGTHTYWVATAEAKALGLLSGSGSDIDGYIGFDASANTFDYDNSNGVSPGLYDFFGVVAHEITEVMGRQTMDGASFQGTPSYEPADLFHYSAPSNEPANLFPASAVGVRDFVGTTAGYFSPDGGTTNLGSFNTNPNGDFGDWASSVGHDSFLAFSNSGVVNPVSANDLALMDVLGWDASYASQTVNNPDGTQTVTTYDATDSLPWSTHVSTYDTANRLTVETYNEDNGTVWTNAYDAANTANWTWSTSNYAANGQLISATTTFDDGTHSLAVHDNVGTRSYADFTIAFDANWNVVSETGTDHHGAALSATQINTAFDTVAWFTHPVDPAKDFLLA